MMWGWIVAWALATWLFVIWANNDRKKREAKNIEETRRRALRGIEECTYHERMELHDITMTDVYNWQRIAKRYDATHIEIMGAITRGQYWYHNHTRDGIKVDDYWDKANFEFTPNDFWEQTEERK